MSRNGGHLRDQTHTESGEGASGVFVTPEAVVIDLETGGIASRLLAGLIDMAIRIGILLVAASIGGVVALGGAGFGESSGQILLVFTVLLLILGYPVFFETLWRGQTPGKRAVGLRAVTLDGSPARFREAWLRSLGGVADLLLPPGGVTGLLFVWSTPRNQRIGDLLAGTIVVRDRTLDGRSGAFWFDPPAGYESYAESIDPTAMTVAQYTLVRSFLLRVHELSEAARYAVAIQIADPLAIRLHHERPAGVPAEAFLLCAVARYQRQHLPRQLAQTMVAAPLSSPYGPPLL